MADFAVHSDFPGANAIVTGIEGNTVHLLTDWSSSSEWWFWWCFSVTGAGGRTLSFEFDAHPYVGWHGAAVSHDLTEWHWSGAETRPDEHRFRYSFAPDENLTYFAMCIPYRPEHLTRFFERYRLIPETLCRSERGRAVPLLRLGRHDAPQTILLTARHHACEATGSYLLEGMLSELLEHPGNPLLRDYEILAVPFVDYDGVVDGEQGKGRIPHDHNRDYHERRYASVDAIRNLTDARPPRYQFDLHSPWILHGRNDKLFFVLRDEPILSRVHERFSRLFSAELSPETLAFDRADSIPPEVEWNRNSKPGLSCSGHYSWLPTTEMAVTVETCYFGLPGNVVTAEKLVNTGRALLRALTAYEEEYPSGNHFRG